jgi:hypothetical protein
MAEISSMSLNGLSPEGHVHQILIEKLLVKK